MAPMQLREFQKTAVDFLQARDFALLLDDAGLGKSADVLAAADGLGLSRVLVVGPAAAGVSWPAEVQKWSPGRKFVNIDLGLVFGFSLPGVYFVSYDTLSIKRNLPLAQELVTCPRWDVLVLDEGQYLKNPGANRTQAVYGWPHGLVNNAARCWVLSGTLTPNHAGEAYTHLSALFPAVLTPAFGGRVPERHEFEDRYCRVRDTVYGRVIEGSTRQNELRRMVAPIMLRRRKMDVLTELLPLEWFIAPIEADPAATDALILAGAEPAASSERRELGLSKVPGCLQWIEDRLAAGEPKIIVFAYHTEVLTRLHDGLADHNPVLFHGASTPAERDEAVRRFQADPDVRAFIGQIHAAGTAITLHASRCVFFAEFVTTPGVNYQAAARAHRLGQRNGVQVYFGSVPGSLDVQIAATAARRAREIAELFD